MSEIWKKLPGLGDKYEISNLGRVNQAALAHRTTSKTIKKYFERVD